MRIAFTKAFFKQLGKYDADFQSLIFEKVEEFKNIENHERLRVHKLHGKFSKCFSFSVDFRTRIVFEYLSKNEVALLAVGDHDIYK